MYAHPDEVAALEKIETNQWKTMTVDELHAASRARLRIVLADQDGRRPASPFNRRLLAGDAAGVAALPDRPQRLAGARAGNRVEGVTYTGAF